MPRSSRWRSGLRNGSRPVGRVPARVTLVPEPANRLADGVLVEAQVRARLFGAPILRLDAEVLLSPARADVVPGAAAGNSADASAEPPRPVAADRPGAGVPLPPGSDLARAAALVQSSARSLHELERGVGRPPRRAGGGRTG